MCRATRRKAMARRRRRRRSRIQQRRGRGCQQWWSRRGWFWRDGDGWSALQAISCFLRPVYTTHASNGLIMIMGVLRGGRYLVVTVWKNGKTWDMCHTFWAERLISWISARRYTHHTMSDTLSFDFRSKCLPFNHLGPFVEISFPLQKVINWSSQP